MPRPTVSSRRPAASQPAPRKPPQPAPRKPPQEVDDMALRTVTTAIRRDLWREINKLAIDQECTIQDAMNRAVYAYLLAENYTVTVPLE